MTVRDVVSRYPVGTVLDVWVWDWAGASHLGRFTVERYTLRLEDGRRWGQLMRELSLRDPQRPRAFRICCVAPADQSGCRPSG